VERPDQRVIREISDPEAEMVSPAPQGTQDPPAPPDPPGPLDLEGTLLLRWLVVLMRRLEALRWE